MGLPWVRLDTGWPTNHKVLALLGEGPRGKSAAVVYIGGLCYSGEHGLDGFIPAYVLPVIHGTKKEADLLVDHGFWSVAVGGDGTGWQVESWGDYQESNAETAARSERARQAAMRRWSKGQVNGKPRKGKGKPAT